ncbi:MAG: penicillin-binding protein 1B, partial [Desulfurivibrio sp.]|nr:penicillin-binding protein 1B [Desulfurivibrio sp.]
MPKKLFPKKKGRRGHRWTLRRIAVAATLLALVVFALYVIYLDKVIRQKFDGKRWALPAVVYARPLELYPGLVFTPAMLAEE